MVPKGYTYGLVIFFALATVYGAPSGPCPNREPVSSDIVLLPDTANCSIYYNCSAGDPVRETCSSGLVFDSGAQTCRPPTADGCRPPETQADPAKGTLFVTHQESTMDSTVAVVTKSSSRNTAARNFSSENGHLKLLGNGTEYVTHSIVYDYWKKENISYPSENFTENASTKENPKSLEVIPFTGSGVLDTHTPTESRKLYNFSGTTYYDSRTETMHHNSPHTILNRLGELTKHLPNSSLRAHTTHESPTSRASTKRLALDSGSSYTQYVDEAFNTVTTTPSSRIYTSPIILSNYSSENSTNQYVDDYLIQTKRDTHVSSPKYHTTRNIGLLVVPTTEGSTYSKNYKPPEIPVESFPLPVKNISSHYENGTTDSKPYNIPTKQSGDFTYQDELVSTNVFTWTEANVQDEVPHTQYPELIPDSTYTPENYISNANEPENYLSTKNINVPRDKTSPVVVLQRNNSSPVTKYETSVKSDTVYTTSYSTNEFSIQTESVETKTPRTFITFLVTRNNYSEHLQKYFPSIYSIHSTTVSPYKKHGSSTSISSQTPREISVTSETTPQNHLTTISHSVKNQIKLYISNQTEVTLSNHLTTSPSVVTNKIPPNIVEQSETNPTESLGVKHVNTQPANPSLSAMKDSINQQNQSAGGSKNFAKNGNPYMSDHFTAAFLSNSTVTSILHSTEKLPSLSFQSAAATSTWLGMDTTNLQTTSSSDLAYQAAELPLNEFAYDSVKLANQSSPQSSIQSGTHLHEHLSVDSVALTTRAFNETPVQAATQSTFSHLPFPSAANQNNKSADAPHNLGNQRTFNNSNMPVQHAKYLTDHSANLSVPRNDNITVSVQSPANLFTEPIAAVNNQLVAEYTMSPIDDPDQTTTQWPNSDYETSTTKQSITDYSVLSSQVLMESNFQSTAASKAQSMVVTGHLTTKRYRNTYTHSVVFSSAEPTSNTIDSSLNNTRTFSHTNYSSHFLDTQTKSFTSEIHQNVLPTYESIIALSHSSVSPRILTEAYRHNFSQNSNYGSEPNFLLTTANWSFIPQSFASDNNFTEKYLPVDLRTPIQVVVQDTFITETIMSSTSPSPLYAHDQGKTDRFIDSQKSTQEVGREPSEAHTSVSLSPQLSTHDHNLASTYQPVELQKLNKGDNLHLPLTSTYLPSSSQSPVPNLTKTESLADSKTLMESIYSDRFITRTSMNVTAQSPIRALNLDESDQPFELRNSTEVAYPKLSLSHTFKTSTLSNAHMHDLLGTGQLTDLHNSTQEVDPQHSLTDTFFPSSSQSTVDLHSFIKMDKHIDSQQRTQGDDLNISITHTSIPISPKSYTYAHNLANTEKSPVDSRTATQGDYLNILLNYTSVFTSPQTPVYARYMDNTNQSIDSRNSTQRVYSELSLGNTSMLHTQSLIYAHNVAKTDRPIESRISAPEFDPKLLLTHTSTSPLRQSHQPSHKFAKTDKNNSLQSSTQVPYPELSLINIFMTSPSHSSISTHSVNKPAQPINSQNTAKGIDRELSLVHTSFLTSPKLSVTDHSLTTVDQVINSQNLTQGNDSEVSPAHGSIIYLSQSSLHAYNLLETDKPLISINSIEEIYPVLALTNTSVPPPHAHNVTKTDEPITSKISNSTQGLFPELLLTQKIVTPSPQTPAYSHNSLSSLISSKGLVTELSFTPAYMPSSPQSQANTQNLTKIDHLMHSQQSIGVKGAEFLVTHASKPHSPQLPVHSHNVANDSQNSLNNLLSTYFPGIYKVYTSTRYKNTVQNTNTANPTSELPTTTFFQSENLSLQTRKDSLATVTMNPVSDVPFILLTKPTFDFPLSVKNVDASNTSNYFYKLSIVHSGETNASSGGPGDNFSNTKAKNVQISTHLTSDVHLTNQVTDKFPGDLLADTTVDPVSQATIIYTTAPDVFDPAAVASATKGNGDSVHLSTVSAKYQNNNEVKVITSSSSPAPFLGNSEGSGLNTSAERVQHNYSPSFGIFHETTSQGLSELSHSTQTPANRASATTERGKNMQTISTDSRNHDNIYDTQMQANSREKENVENLSSVEFKEPIKISKGTTETSHNGYLQSIHNSILSYLISLINAFSTSEIGISTVNQPKGLVDYENDDSILIAKNPREISTTSSTAETVELKRVTKPRITQSHHETTATQYFSGTTKVKNRKKGLNNEISGKNVVYEMKAFNNKDDNKSQESDKNEDKQREKKTNEEINKTQEQRQNSSGKTDRPMTNRKKRESTEESEEGSNESDTYVEKHMNNGKFNALFLVHKSRESSDESKETSEDSSSEKKRHIKRGTFREIITKRKGRKSSEGSKENNEGSDSSDGRNKMRRKFEGRMATHTQREESVEIKDTSEDSDSTVERYIKRGKFKVRVEKHKGRESSERSNNSSEDSDSS